MKKSALLKLTSAPVLAAMLMLSACSNSSTPAAQPEASAAAPAAGTTAAEAPATVEITDIHGKVTVPVNPEKVVALDNRTFETLSDWGIKLAAAPKTVMPADSPYVADESVQNIGDHREPNLEILAAADPDLVIVGQRFSGYYEDIKKLVPNAAVVDFSFDVSEKSATPGENLVKGLEDSTVNLGKIFDKTAEADALIAKFDDSIAKAKAAYNGTDKVMSVIVSGGDIGFAAPHYGRVWGPMYEIFGWTPALEVAASSTDHQGDDISVEAIAQSNPDWIFVLDRDAAIASETEAVPAQDVIDKAPALKNTKAIKEGHTVYAPNDTYTNESIQTYIELFDNLAATLAE
ncbi:siderophore ABC transporter substrate-binding protein [Saccharibacillus alkalitolerans]|uniref:Siderophore ABC transporter substrate-binding protein n=1 Tax=Saccharibacillus alkalitolerans TaxID=2705290 RepID=A0ABX0F2P6_9BACL|nr:siderophore ABC transporter substrate-binding protein [Saccharibacillus alkalitolerans]NGZ75262.1 siderophore ABC transporter substrate-binding protein [Saccharibacillus alkalitolerans]